jgi:hypothetical protein
MRARRKSDLGMGPLYNSFSFFVLLPLVHSVQLSELCIESGVASTPDSLVHNTGQDTGYAAHRPMTSICQGKCEKKNQFGKYSKGSASRGETGRVVPY